MKFHTHALRQSERILKPSFQKKFGLVFLGILLIAGGVWGVSEYRYREALKVPNSGAADLKLFTIETAESVDEVAQSLAENNFVNAPEVFTKYFGRNYDANKVLPGRFYLAQNLTVPDLATKLFNNEKREVFFTIPEGLTLKEIDERLSEKGYAPKGEFLDCVQQSCDFSAFAFLPKDRSAWEGYFFPETYAIYPENFSAADLGRKMLQEFEKRADAIGILKEKNLGDIVIMASLVEKESRDDAERPVIAGILWKRLKEHWLLGVDATVRYFTQKKSEELTEDDLNADNPYNTRKHQGLPPTAIANPGESALRAAAFPKASPYYYYLHGSAGKTYFATTNAEHNLNKERYL